MSSTGEAPVDDPSNAEHGRAPLEGARPSRVLAVVVAVLAVAFVAHAARWVAAPLGSSHDGRNGAAWALAARSLRDDPIGHRLGGIRPDGTPYANHPPAIVALTAVTTLATGDRPIGVRLPAVLATVATLALLAAVLRDLRHSTTAIVVGLGLAATSPMLLGYGTMLDTPVLGLPAFLGALWVGIRARQAPTPAATPSARLAAAVGLLTGLVAWQAALGAWLVAAWLVAGRTRRPRTAPTAVGLSLGAVVGGALSAAWAWWAYGSPTRLFDSLETRAGAAGGWLDAQGSFLGATFGWPRLALVALGVVAALATRRRTGPILVALATVAIWTVALRDGATIHGYWSYFGIAVVALGGASATEVVVEVVPRRAERLELGRLVPLVGVVAALALVLGLGSTLVMTNAPEAATLEGLDAGRLAARLPRASEPDEVAVIVLEGNLGGGTSPIWASWPTHGAVLVVPSDEAAAAAERHPEASFIIEATDPLQFQAMLEAGARDSEGITVVFDRLPG